MDTGKLPEPTIALSLIEARRFVLAHQRLWPPRSLDGKAGILDYVRHVGCIQFDPIEVVGRNADLVLQARISGYRPALLAELLYGDRLLWDGWDKVPADLLAAADPNLTDEEYQEWHLLRRVGGLGLALPNGSAEAWLNILGVGAPERRAALARMAERGGLLAAAVEGVPGRTFFLRSADIGGRTASPGRAIARDRVAAMGTAAAGLSSAR